MRHQQTLSSWVAVSLVALATFSVKAAHASTSCGTDADCGKGFSCQVTGGAGCASPACPPGETCDAAPPCNDVVFKSCEPATCTTDSDCGADMVCYQASAVACPAIACAKGANCPPVVCDPAPKQCTPKYELPCTTDSDCGSGFSCHFGEECSGSTGSADAGTPAIPSNPGAGGSAATPSSPPGTTTCTTSTIGSCQLTPVTCKTDSDCQTGWSCTDITAGYGCAEAGTSSSSASAGASSAADGGAPLPPASGGSADGDAGTPITITCPSPPPPTYQCTPPGYSAVYNSNAGSGTLTATGSAGGTSVGTASAGGASSNGATSGAAPATPDRGAANGASGNATPTPTAATSCSVSTPGGASNRGFVLLALGLFGFIRRRRAAARA